MSRLILVIALLALGTALADTIVLKNGESFQGDFFGATSQEIRFVVNGKLMYFQATEIELIRFGDGPAAESAPPVKAPPELAEEPAPEAPKRPETPAEAGSAASIPPPSPQPPPEPEEQPVEVSASARYVGAGTPLHVKLLEQVDMAQDSLGSTYRGALEKPVRLESEQGKPVAIPAGAEVQLRLADKREVESSNTTATGLEATGLRYRGHTIPIRTGKGFRQPRSTKDKAAEGLARTASTLGRVLGGMAGREATTTAEDTVGDAWDRSTIPAGTMIEFLLTEGVDVAWPSEPASRPAESPEQFVASTPDPAR